MIEWTSERVVIAATGASPRNLKFWRINELLPEVRVRHLGKAHGTVTEYRPATIPIVRGLMAMRGRRLDACRWALWLDEDMPSEVTAWLGQRVTSWSEKLLRGAKQAVDEAGPAKTRDYFTRKPTRHRPPVLRQLYKRLDHDKQWYDFMSALAMVAGRRQYTPTPSFFAAIDRLGVPAEAASPPPGSLSVFDGFDLHNVIANAQPEDISAARELWLKHFGSFDRPAVAPPPDWASVLLSEDWRDFAPVCACALAALILIARDLAVRPIESSQ